MRQETVFQRVSLTSSQLQEKFSPIACFTLETAKSLLVFCLIFVLGCAASSSDDGDETDDNTTEMESVFDVTGTTNERGIATVSFGIAENTTKFSVSSSVRDDDLFLRFTEATSSAGVDYLTPDGESISFADAFLRSINSLSIPSRSEDPSVDPTNRFIITAELSASDVSATRVSGETVTFSVISKADPNLESGTLAVNVFYVGDVGQDDVTRSVVEPALGQMQDLLRSQSSIGVNINEIAIDGPVVLPLPVEGDRYYASASAGAPSPAVNIFISGDVDAGDLGGTVLGISAGIPGPPQPSPRSAIAISFFAGAGPDGFYSSEDIRLLGETLAHETGHFLGLFHPVDFGGSTVVATDPLDDTPSCSFITECLSNNDLITNLMFPSPVSAGDGTFISQDVLTRNQRSVQNRYIVVD